MNGRSKALKYFILFHLTLATKILFICTYRIKLKKGLKSSKDASKRDNASFLSFDNFHLSRIISCLRKSLHLLNPALDSILFNATLLSGTSCALSSSWEFFRARNIFKLHCYKIKSCCAKTMLCCKRMMMVVKNERRLNSHYGHLVVFETFISSFSFLLLYTHQM